MLLPIFAPLIPPILAILPCAFEFVPALVAIVLKILASLLTLLPAVGPRFVPIVHPTAPLIVAILRTLTPIRPLFWASRVLARAWSF
jgi:hypothetical protein